MRYSFFRDRMAPSAQRPLRIMHQALFHRHTWRSCDMLFLKFCIATLFLHAISLMPAKAASAAPLKRPEILVLLSYHQGHSWEDRILSGINEWRNNSTPEMKPILHTEWLDTKRYPGEEQRSRISKYLAEKYADKSFDLILTVDDNALDIIANHSNFSKKTPIVFSGINGSPGEIIGDLSEVTGILERFDLTQTLRTALLLHSRKNNIIFITPHDEVGKSIRKDIDTVMSLQPAGLTAEHWITPDLSKIQDRLVNASRDSLVFVLGSIPEKNGSPPLDPEETVTLIHSLTNFPVYSDLDTAVGKGAVGGYMNSGLETGRLQAVVAKNILGGEMASQIPYVLRTPLALIFDYDELNRFNINKSMLPPGSKIINEPSSIFDPKYRKFLIGFMAAIAMLLTCVAVLVVRSRIQAERQRALHYQASHDDLTGLPNRHELPELLKKIERNFANEGGRIALIMLGINRFKRLNNTYGHSFGDAVVKAVAERLSLWCTENEVLSRFGGDSFVIISSLQDKDALNNLRSRCESIFVEPLFINSQQISISVAFGISLSIQNQDNIENMLREADTAMHEAKRNGRTTVVSFDKHLYEQTARQFQIESDLPDAIENGDLKVYYQPIIDTQQGVVAGFEALARWLHPKLGAISPPEFIVVATESGYIEKLTQYILRKSCEAFAPHLKDPNKPYLGVNISVSDIYTGELPSRLEKILQETGMPANRLVLEVTEDMLLHDEHLATDVLAKIRKQGVKIAIDDFGTGYSSMGYLSRYQINMIKIDRSFVQNITTCPQDQKIVRAIVSMAKDLELGIITEGVENTEQSDLLKKMGCILQQGYLFSKPLPASSWSSENSTIHLEKI